ncbi:MAG: hypothetical protein H7Z40_10705 [Phycisphaerae bacterium]|nr:hypothetical protein [Gemmatimonadaceae bacterium]
MNKILLGLILGGVLGVFDGLSALVSAPETRPEIMTIVLGSTGKGLVAGAIIGWFARRKNNLGMGIVFGLVVSGLIALPIALSRDPNTGQQYFWEILIPGALVGLIVGYATQRYGARPVPVR